MSAGENARMGLMISLTREVVMELKAPPMMTPTARSITLPRAIKDLNSWMKALISKKLPFYFLRL